MKARRDRGNASLVSIRIDGFPVLIMIDKKQNISDWVMVKALLVHKANDIKNVVRQEQIADFKQPRPSRGTEAEDAAHDDEQRRLNRDSFMSQNALLRDDLSSIEVITGGDSPVDWMVQPWEDYCL